VVGTGAWVVEPVGFGPLVVGRAVCVGPRVVGLVVVEVEFPVLGLPAVACGDLGVDPAQADSTSAVAMTADAATFPLTA
jgi:hypothetical protein